MFSLAENLRIDPKIQFPGPPRVLRTSGGRGIAKRISGEIEKKKCPARNPPIIF
jgi:hypothetical protein